MDSPAPLLSVAMITYNHEKYVAAAIDSILNQRIDFDYEVVVGEDCSTDRTSQVLARYYEKYPDKIRVITSGSNVGMHANIERTERACKGKYLAYLEGDDYFSDPDKIRKQVAFLESHDDYGMVHGDYNAYFQDEDRLENSYNKLHHKKIVSGDIFDQLLIRNLVATCTVCIRRELLVEYFDYGEIRKRKWTLGDYPRWLQIAAHSKVMYMDESLSTYRVLANSATHSPDGNATMGALITGYEVREYYIEKYGCPESLKARIRRDYYIELMERALRVRDVKLATETYTEMRANVGVGVKPGIEHYMCYWGARNSLVRLFARLYFRIKRILAS